jgi:hypothetical protein
MGRNWERIHEESRKTLVSLLYYIGAGMLIFGSIFFAYYANKNQYYSVIHNRGFAILGIGLMSVGTIGYFSNRLPHEQKTFTAIFTKSLLALFYSTGTFCLTLSILRSN